MSSTAETQKPGPDWERIEGDYRAGLLSLREIAARDGNNVTEAAIRKRAKKHGWERDLSARIQARADALLVRREAVRAAGSQLAPECVLEVIEVNAQVIAQVRAEHRSDISRGRALTVKLLAELEAQSGDPALFAELGEMMRNADERGVDKLNDIYQRVIGLPGRIEGAKKLSETLKNLITLEREAYDIRPAAEPGNKDNPPPGGSGVLVIDDDRLIAIAAGGRG